jgi:hypothetical protein
LTALWFCGSSSTMSKDFILNMCSYGLFMKVNFHSCIMLLDYRKLLICQT